MRQLYYIRNLSGYIKNRENVARLEDIPPDARQGYKWYKLQKSVYYCTSIAAFGTIPRAGELLRVCGKTTRIDYDIEYIELPKDSIVIPRGTPTAYSQSKCPQKYKLKLESCLLEDVESATDSVYTEEQAERICNVCLQYPNDIEFDCCGITIHNPNVLPPDFLNGITYHPVGTVKAQDVVLLKQPLWAEPIPVLNPACPISLSEAGREFWKDFIIPRNNLVSGAKKLFDAGVRIDAFTALADSDDLLVCKFSRNGKKQPVAGLINNYIADILKVAPVRFNTGVVIKFNAALFAQDERLDRGSVRIIKSPKGNIYSCGWDDVCIDSEGNLKTQIPTWLPVGVAETVNTKYGVLISENDESYIDFSEALRCFAVHYTDYKKAQTDLSHRDNTRECELCISRKYCRIPMGEMVDFIRKECGGCFYPNFWGYSKEENLQLYNTRKRDDIVLVMRDKAYADLQYLEEIRTPPSYNKGTFQQALHGFLQEWGVSEIKENPIGYPGRTIMLKLLGIPYTPEEVNFREYVLMRNLPTIQDPSGNIYLEKKYLTIPQLLEDLKASNILIPGFIRLVEGFLGREQQIKKALCALI